MRVVILLVLVIVLAGCATTAPPSTVAEAKARLTEVVRADIIRGVEIATAANDIAAMACGNAILDALPPEGAASLTPIGVFSTYIAGRELHRKVTAGVDEKLHIACAPLILDAEQTLVKLGLIAAPGGGALGGLMPR